MSGIATEMGATEIVTGATTINGAIGNGAISKEVTGKGTTAGAMTAGQTVGILIAAPAIPPATNEKGTAAPSSSEVCQGQTPKQKPGAPLGGCTGPDVDRHALRGDGRSFAGREGLSRFFINNREAYWFHLLHNSSNRNRLKERIVQ